MTRNGWAQFESTGRIADYLAYSRQDQEKRKTEEMKESERAHGADHCTYRHGAISDAHRGL